MTKILIIDDNELIGKMLKEALTDQGFEVHVAIDANQGYSAAIELLPDLMLVDVQLPDVIGFDLIRIIKNREDLQDIPIIMVTGTAHKTEEKVRGFQMGADDYILKPFEMPELMERIRAILRRTQKREKPVSVEPSPGSEASIALPAPPESPAPVAVQEAPPEPAVPVLRETEFLLDPPPPAEPEKAAAPAVEELPLWRAVPMLLFDPIHFPFSSRFPGISMAFLSTALALALAGLAMTSGTSIKPVLAGFAIVGCWGTLVAVTVMMASLLGISLSWKEGARLLSLAGLPMLLKLLGALVMSVWTTLSPFYYTGGPALFMKSAPLWVERLDVFEIWVLVLLWIFLRARPGSSEKKAGIVTFLVWLTAFALAAGLGKLGTP